MPAAVIQPLINNVRMIPKKATVLMMLTKRATKHGQPYPVSPTDVRRDD
jgi:hypothetical protein